jgi:hypothetical protein
MITFITSLLLMTMGFNQTHTAVHYFKNDSIYLNIECSNQKCELKRKNPNSQNSKSIELPNLQAKRMHEISIPEVGNSVWILEDKKPIYIYQLSGNFRKKKPSLFNSDSLFIVDSLSVPFDRYLSKSEDDFCYETKGLTTIYTGFPPKLEIHANSYFFTKKYSGKERVELIREEGRILISSEDVIKRINASETEIVINIRGGDPSMIKGALPIFYLSKILPYLKKNGRKYVLLKTSSGVGGKRCGRKYLIK